MHKLKYVTYNHNLRKVQKEMIIRHILKTIQWSKEQKEQKDKTLHRKLKIESQLKTVSELNMYHKGEQLLLH
jgi:hypothetical protein